MKYAPAYALALILAAAPGAAPLADGGARNEDGGALFLDEQELRDLGDLAQETLRRFAERMAPLADRLGALIDNLDAYAAPEMLPNGDIIIRRKPDAPPLRDAPAPPPIPEGGITL